MSVHSLGAAWKLDIPHEEMLVLLAMVDHADHEGRNIRPGLGLVAWKTGYTRRHVRKVIRALEYKGILVATAAQYGKPTNYHFNPDAWAQKKPRTIHPLDANLGQNALGQNALGQDALGHLRHGVGHPGPPNHHKPSEDKDKKEGEGEDSRPPKKSRKRKVKTEPERFPLPDTFIVTDGNRAWFEREYPDYDCDKTTERWKDEMWSNGIVRADWNAAYRAMIPNTIKWDKGVKKPMGW